MMTATIFYIDRQLLDHQDNPWGVRYDASALPMGSVVVGFMKWEEKGSGGQVLELIDPPAMSPSQEQSWDKLLSDARTVLNGRNTN
jgi:hypothetical protein